MNDANEVYGYVGKCKNNGMGVDRVVGSSYTITDYKGNVIGNATKGSSWRVNSFIGTHMHQFYAIINGREYTGRSFGTGMSIRLRLTAAEKKKEKQAIMKKKGMKKKDSALWQRLKKRSRRKGCFYEPIELLPSGSVKVQSKIRGNTWIIHP